MQESPFFRITGAEDKGSTLLESITALREGDPVIPSVFLADTLSFRQVPGSPFAYWVSEGLRRKFTELSLFESGGRTAKVGLQTGDDFRFIRAWWEVATPRILDGSTGPYHDVTLFRDWCQKRTFQGKHWVPFAKGGEYSPYYADIHLVVHWEQDGAQIKAFAGPLGRLASRAQNTDNYFRPGLTWPRRTNGLSFRALPAGCIFGDKGPAAFTADNDPTDLLVLNALANSRPFLLFVQVQLARVELAQSFEVGLIQATPVPAVNHSAQQALTEIVQNNILIRQTAAGVKELSHAFVLPALLQAEGETLIQRAQVWAQLVKEMQQALAHDQAQIDDIANRLNGISEEDDSANDATLGGATISDGGATDEYDDEDSIATETAVDGRQLARDLVSYAVGCTFGRWDVRMAIDHSLIPKLAGPFDPLPVCSPGMLVDSKGLSALGEHIASEEWLRARPNVITLPLASSVRRAIISQDDYPLRVSWDGVLVDDPDHTDDIVLRVRQVFELLWGDRAPAVEDGACSFLGATTLGDYLRKPNAFFADHFKEYSKSRRKAPIYWPLSTRSGSYTLWLYYPRLTSDTLFTAINRYVEPKLAGMQRERYELETVLGGASGREAARLREQIEDTRKLIDELEELRAELQRVAALPYQPNLDDGVIINAAPLHRLFGLSRWAKDTRETWEKLERGDYDWAHLAYAIWPERVREKCRSDRSLAIAHGLESLYEVPPESSTRRRKRKASATLEGGHDL